MTNVNLPKIAIIGRPNVGKSSLFNAIVGSRKAIVESATGTTRDRLFAEIKWKGKRFILVDTGGFDESKLSDMKGLVLKQLETAIKEADIIFFVTDSTAGVVPQDTELSSRLRKTSKKIYLIANKIDDRSQASKALDFFELGIGEPYAVSATNDIGIRKLLDDAANYMANPGAESEAESVKVAIVGRPNVGKSSYLNSILNEERSIVHHVAGTTRDAIDTGFEYKGKKFLLIDTAGIRHNMKLKESVDFFGSVRSKEAIKRSDVAIVMIDGFDGLREDDSRIINFVIDEGKALVIAVNKWDLAKGAETARYKEMLISKLNLIKNYPVIFMSSKTGKNVPSVLDAAWAAYEKSKIIFKPDELISVLEMLNNSPEIRNRSIKFLYLAQKGRTPPEFVLGVKKAGMMNENLRRYAENFLRRVRDFEGVPIRMSFEMKSKR